MSLNVFSCLQDFYCELIITQFLGSLYSVFSRIRLKQFSNEYSTDSRVLLSGEFSLLIGRNRTFQGPRARHSTVISGNADAFLDTLLSICQDFKHNSTKLCLIIAPFSFDEYSQCNAMLEA